MRMILIYIHGFHFRGLRKGEISPFTIAQRVPLRPLKIKTSCEEEFASRRADPAPDIQQSFMVFIMAPPT